MRPGAALAALQTLRDYLERSEAMTETQANKIAALESDVAKLQKAIAEHKARALEINAPILSHDVILWGNVK